MNKTLAILVALMLGLAPVSFAATALTDSELDQVSAGDWVVLTDASGNQTVEDVYHSNNTIDLQDESQKDLQAVSNANAVDSAIAVQTNIASVTGSPTNNVAVNGSNKADITNYNPSESSASASSSSSASESASSSLYGAAADYTLEASKSSSASSSLVETLDEVETLDILASSASSESTNCKKCSSESASASAFLLDYDKNVDYDKVALASSGSSESVKEALHVSEVKSESSSSKSSSSESSSSSSRKNLGENNHLNLKDNSQQQLQAVSNLNAVGSGAAIQTNIASNVGVSGTITHVNVATVVNGL